jgi:hypothetical protein
VSGVNAQASTLGVTATSASNDERRRWSCSSPRAEVNTIELLLNRIVYILEANGMTS